VISIRKNVKIIFITVIGVSCFTALIIFSLFFLPLIIPENVIRGRNTPLSEVHNITLKVEYVTQPTEIWDNISLYGYNTAVLDALEEKCDVELSIFGTGKLVIGINDVRGDWVYYVNGLFAGVGAADYYLNDSDSIHWKHVNV
jgi:hypothetical protein